MKIFSAAQVRAIDTYTINNEPIRSVDLMERAADAIYRWFAGNVLPGNLIVVLAGPGNNGGDGLALARMLLLAGYAVDVYYLKASSYSDDFQVNLKKLSSMGISIPHMMTSSKDFPAFANNQVIVDSLFGAGLTKPIAGLAAELINHVNNASLKIISIDIPSGLFFDNNPFPNGNPVVRASFTLTFHALKLSLLFPENELYTGRVVVLPIGLHPDAISQTHSPYTLLNERNVKPLLRGRSIFSHKGSFGHSLIIAGSYGMLGASVLASKACMRSGAGLVTAHIPRLGYSVLQHSAPEVLVEVDDNDWCFTQANQLSRFSAVCVGPGLGKASRTIAGLRSLMCEVKSPLLIDADGLNILAQTPELLNVIPANTVITPHPGEFDRLFGASFCGFDRLVKAIEMARQYRVTIVLKGAYTQVVSPDGRVFFNSTGNAGMATGGSGDVLSGVITSLLGQGYNPLSAAIIGVYAHGMAGDYAAESMGGTALTASDLIIFLGKAFQTLENHDKD